MCKNPDQENDVSIAFGTLVPFFSTGVKILHPYIEICKTNPLNFFKALLGREETKLFSKKENLVKLLEIDTLRALIF